MKNIEMLCRRAAGGDKTALDKLISAAKPEIKFLCAALCTDKIIQNQACKTAAGVISDKILSGNSYKDFSAFIRKQTAEICIQMTGERIFAENISDRVALTSADMDSVLLPAEVLTDYYAVNEAMQLIYYSTRNFEYHMFILCYYAGFTVKEAASLYHISEADGEIILLNTIEKIRHSISVFRPDEKRAEIKFTSLLDSAAKLRPAAVKKSVLLSDGEPFYKTNTGKALIVGAFALLLIFIFIQVIFPMIIGTDKPQTDRPAEYNYDISYENHNVINETDQPAVSESLYVDLVCDEICDSEVLGISTEGFVNESEQVSVFQIIVTNSTSDMISSSDLQVSFSDGTPNFEGMKSYFTYNVFSIDERTYLINIFAPGSYGPDQFMVDMYKNGAADSSYILPTEIRAMDNLRADVVANNSYTGSIPHNSIIRILDDDSEYYYYIYRSDIQIVETPENTVSAEASLILIPVGGITLKDNTEFFEFVHYPDPEKKYEDIVENISIERVEQTESDLPPYISIILYRIEADVKTEDTDSYVLTNALSGYFSYKDDTMRIELYRF